MFQFKQPSADAIESTLAAARNLPPASPALLTLLGGPIAPQPPRGFVHDVSCLEIGRGPAAFDRACRALSAWEHFNLGWVRVANSDAPIRSGSIIAVEIQTVGLWSLNLSRIVETVNTETLAGFIYATTSMHVEEGKERFLIAIDPGTEAVTYLIEAISRPRHPLARVAYPFTRLMQHRFVIDSLRRMRNAADPPTAE